MVVKSDKKDGVPSGLDPSLESAVPSDQRPVNELQSLKAGQLFSWGTLEFSEYVKRLAAVFMFFFVFVSGPISYQTFDPIKQPAEWLLSSCTGSLVVVAVVIIRIYLGWSYVGDRLVSVAVEYEETGWYDGQVFVKPPEVLTRDRLLAMYEVKPVMRKLRSTLVGSGASLLATSLLLLIIMQSGIEGLDERTMARTPRVVTSDGVIYSDRVRDLSSLAYDDELAAAEAEAMNGVPGYCGDRALRALAGGQYCDKFTGGK